MKTKISIAIVSLIGFFYWLPEPTQNVPLKLLTEENSQPTLSNDFIIRNVRFYDGYQLFEKMDVQIEQNRVKKIAAKIPQQSLIPEFNGTGQTLLPGLIDAHTHAYGNALRDALNFGVTTEMDMFTMPEFANPEQNNRDQLDNSTKADLFSSTILATTKGGHGTEYGFEIPVINAVNEVEDFVIQRISQSADYIKAVYNSVEAKRQFFPSISKPVLAALIKSAHQHDLMIVVHVDNLISATEAIELGADGIVHSFMDAVIDEHFVKLMQNSKSFMIATLSIEGAISGQSKSRALLESDLNKDFLSREQKIQLKTEFPDFGVPAIAFENAKHSVQILSNAGVTILAGTDAPNPSTTHGLSLHGELQFLVEAGLTPEQAIHSATGAVTESFSIASRGTLKLGAMASMILIDGNPFQDIALTQNITQIWKNGTPLKRFNMSEDDLSLTQIEQGVISSFSQSIKDTQRGLGIFESSDKLAGGKSEVHLELMGKPDLKDTFLDVSGELKDGFMFLWGGISFIPGESQQKGADFRLIKKIVFDAKAGGKTNSISVLLFQQGSFQPSAKTIKITQQWKKYKVALSDFKNVDLSAITNISIVVNEGKGKYEFMLDNLELE